MPGHDRDLIVTIARRALAATEMDEIRDFSYEELGRPAGPGECRSPWRITPVFVDGDFFDDWHAHCFIDLVRCQRFRAIGEATGCWLPVGFV